MKTILIILVVLSFASCNSGNEVKKQYKEYFKINIVKSKKETVETTYVYKYNIWKGSFYQQPNIHTVYYLIYRDGSLAQVDLGVFSTTEVGDTIKEKQYGN